MSEGIMTEAPAIRAGGRPRTMGNRTWRILVLACVVIGLAIRVGSVLIRPHLAPNGDPLEYWGQANLLVEGKGWIEPITYHTYGVKQQTADLPPLYTLLLALCSLVGFKSFFAHRIWSAVLSTAGVGIGALLGRDVAGRTVGVLTALGIALYPNLWMSAGLDMSETISPVLVMVVLWAGYRMWRRPTRGRAVALGLAIGVAGLARDEMLVFAALILLPIAWGGRNRTNAERFRLLGSGVAATVLVVAPYVTFNLIRFEHPVLITDRFGLTLASANCDTSWYGPLAGYWSMDCARSSVATVTGDESARDPVATRKGLDFINAHLSDLPRVEYDRLGRTFAFWAVRDQIELDVHVENRPDIPAWTGLWCYYGFVALAPFGVVILRRRGVPLFPLAAVLADVVIVTVITYGQTRFRATFEPVLVLLGAVTLCQLGARLGWFSPPAPECAASPVPSGPRSGSRPGAGRPAASGA